MRTSMVLLCAALAFAGCSNDKSSKKVVLSGASPGDDPAQLEPAPGDDAIKGSVEGDPIALLPETGSSMRLLDGRGLTLFYQNVFAKKKYGYMHCEKVKPLVPGDCFDSIFNRDERPAMGSFDLGTPRMDRSPSNVNPAVNLTLNYTRTLRAALSRECNSLVTAELSALAMKNVMNNVLIKTEKPSPEDLDFFMKKLLGLMGTALVLPIDFAGYVSDFELVRGQSKDSQVGMKNGYVGLCIALSMDPLVFIY